MVRLLEISTGVTCVTGTNVTHRKDVKPIKIIYFNRIH